MSAFAYRAVHASGRIHKGRMKAGNEEELAFALGEMGLELIEARPEKSRSPARPRIERSVRAERKIALCEQMQDLLQAGLPFAEAFALIQETQAPGPFADALQDIARNVKAGSGIAKAFAAPSGLFDPLFLAILETGEQSGNLANAFDRLAQHLRKQETLRRQTLRALRYPLFLLALALGVTTFMMALVVPQIVGFLYGLEGDLPVATHLLIRSADIFASVWWGLPVFLGGIGAAVIAARRLAPGAVRTTDDWLLRLPFLGPVLRQLALARLLTSLHLLINSGLGVPDALALAARSAGNAALAATNLRARDDLVAGQAFSLSMAGLVAPPVVQRIRIGEKSGQLGKTLETIARSYEREAENSLAGFLGALEPALTLLVGGLLVWIVLAVLGPVYGALGPLSRGM